MFLNLPIIPFLCPFSMEEDYPSAAAASYILIAASAYNFALIFAFSFL
jgi:hypothetical protein